MSDCPVGTTWPLVLATPTDRCRRWLRRYETGTCPVQLGRNYHDAMVQIEDGPCLVGPDFTISTEPRGWPLTDPRWPSHCACGHEFTPASTAHLFFERIYTVPPCPALPQGGEGVPRHDLPGPLPVGAVWYADWNQSWRGPDGRCLMLMTPAGEWCIDGPASDSGKPWSRSGVPPLISVSPSIWFNKPTGFHGVVENGVLRKV